MRPLSWGVEAVERGWVSDKLIKFAVRSLCRKRLKQSEENFQSGRDAGFIEEMKSAPIALATDKANEQHYEVPAEFFKTVLGPRLKYSCCFFADDHSSLQEAEVESLKAVCERARLMDGQSILELGCGWGSLSLWMAQQFPGSEIISVTNSNSQAEFIRARARDSGFENLSVVVRDMNDLEMEPGQFDRVVSVEMFEHMRNYELLLARISEWLTPRGLLFVHIFCHEKYCYPFDTEGSANWMGRTFFTGGIMPSANVFENFENDMQVIEQQRWNGSHYSKTLLQWLARHDEHRHEITDMFKQTYGAENAARWFQRWRLFFLSSAEFFQLNDGDEWFVSHYLLQPTRAAVAQPDSLVKSC